MLKKEGGVQWNLEAKNSFELVKHALTQELVLISPDFTKDFLIFSFASEHTVAAILLRKFQRDKSSQLHFSACLLCF